MSEEIKELLFLLHNDRLTEAGKRKLEQEIERLNQYIDFYKDLGEKQNKKLQNLKQINEEHQKLNGELRVENERLNNIINDIYTFLSQYTITHTWQKIVVEDTIKYIEELKGDDKE